MKKINEELNYIKYLFGYQKGVVISEQVTPKDDTPIQPQAQGTPASEPTQGGDGCIPITVSGRFNPKKSDSTEYLQNIINQLDAQIKSKPEFQGGSVTSLRIIGGASNVDNGVKSDFTLNNDYTPSNTTPKQTKEFQNNMGYAQARINAAKQPILDELQKAGLTVAVEPTTEAHVIDTGGTSDGNRKTQTYPNPGQVVIVQMTVCPVSISSGREELNYLKPKDPVKIPVENQMSGIGEIITLKQIPKDFVITGRYNCNGKNSLGVSATVSTFKEQCGKLPTNLRDANHIASWEIKFKPNVTGNKFTVPVTRWNMFWDANGKIVNITSYNFDKNSTPEIETIKNLILTQSPPQTLKDMMYVVSGGNDNYWDNTIAAYSDTYK